MSSDREARAVGAAETIEVEGRQYKLRPISVRHLCDLQREALDYYKRQVLRTYRENADLLADGRLLGKLEEVARWGLHNLPQVDAYDVGGVPLTEAVLEWLERQHGKLPETDAGKKALLANALDVGTFSPEALEAMSGVAPVHGRVRYDQWWVTAVADGQVSFVVSSLKADHPEATIAWVAGWPMGKLVEASRKVESITSADLGNT